VEIALVFLDFMMEINKFVKNATTLALLVTVEEMKIAYPAQLILIENHYQALALAVMV